MTYPQYQPPVMPGAPQSPATWTPSPEPEPKSRVMLVLLVILGVSVLGVGALLTAIALSGDSPPRTPTGPIFAVTVTSCDGSTSSSLATIGYTVTNNSKVTRTATVRIEYRDENNARLDTDTAWVRDVRPGDTVRGEESTFLDAPAGATLKCSITGVG